MHKEAFGQQLPLEIGLRDDDLLDNYYPGDNQQALDQIKQVAQGIGERFIYLWGRPGVGCTHLLQGACHWASRFNRPAMYISMAETIDKSPAVFDGLERTSLICIDDLNVIAGNAEWEEALFHFFNRLRTYQRGLIIAAHTAPKATAIQLPDLQSRLSWGVTYQLHPLDDDQLIAALQLRAKQRGLDMPHEVGLYLIRHCTRSMPELYAILERLDQASMAAQRRLTIPFLKSVLVAA